ncbi:MAG: H-NS family nucleoid-associated regulatory protein [Paracoccaceae bacterium]
MDIKSLSLAELRKLSARVEKAIIAEEKRLKKAALAEIKSVAQKHGLSLAEIAGAEKAPAKKPKVKKAKKKTGAKVAPKYRNPADADQTWTGRGRRPLWVVAALESGKTLDDISI